jgi:hypothetical protein
MTPALAQAIRRRPAVQHHRRRQQLPARTEAHAGADRAALRKSIRPHQSEHRTAPEILLIPRVGKRMTHEFEEYRPWATMAQFDKEIGKYVGAAETNR